MTLDFKYSVEESWEIANQMF